MKLVEFQAKELLSKFNIPIPSGQVISSAAFAEQIRSGIGKEVVLKAQVLTKGRGKAGGIRILREKDSAEEIAADLFGLSINGQKVKSILIEEIIKYKKQYGIRIETDKVNGAVNLFGGDEFAAKGKHENRSGEIKISINPLIGLLDFQIRSTGLFLEIPRVNREDFRVLLVNLWEMFNSIDALRIELAPLVISEANEIIILGTQIEIDDNALYRHPEFTGLFEQADLSGFDFKANKFGIDSYHLNCGVGLLVNDANLGFAIQEILADKEIQLAEILDVGSGASDEKIKAGLDLLNKNRKIELILITFYGGLSRCEEVISGIREALKNNPRELPFVVYINGTGSEARKSLLPNKKIWVTETLTEAINQTSLLSEAQ